MARIPGTTFPDDDPPKESVIVQQPSIVLHEYEWTYIGVRFDSHDGKLFHHWIEESGKSAVFEDGPKFGTIGGIYAMQATEPSEQRKAQSKTPKYLRQAEEKSRLADWRLEDRTARAMFDAVKASRKAKADDSDIGDMTLRELKVKLSVWLPNRRRAMLAVVLDYLQQ